MLLVNIIYFVIGAFIWGSVGKVIIILLFASSCATTSAIYKFTCPDSKVVRMNVTVEELNDQGKLYDKVIAECKERDGMRKAPDAVCNSKAIYYNRHDAHQAVIRAKFRGLTLYPYTCIACGFIHLSKKKGKIKTKKVSIDKINKEINARVKVLDERISFLNAKRKKLENECPGGSIEISELIISIEKLKIEKYQLQIDKKIINEI